MQEQIATVIDSKRIEEKLEWLILNNNLTKYNLLAATDELLKGAPNYKQVLKAVIENRPKEESAEHAAVIFGFILGVLTGSSALELIPLYKEGGN